MIVWTPGAADIGQVIAAELDEIGLRARLVVPPYQEELAEITGPADKRPAEFQLINAGIATSDRARRFAIYSAILKTLSVDVPYVSLFTVRV